MIGYGGGTNQFKVWDLTRKDVVVSRDVVFIEGKPIEQTPAAYINEPRCHGLELGKEKSWLEVRIE